MKFNRAQSIGIALGMVALAVGVTVGGIVLKPMCLSLNDYMRAQEKARAELIKIVSKLTPEQRKQMSECQSNRMQIESLSISYYARYGKNPPGGVIDENHPLVKTGPLKSVITCPSTGKKYVLTVRSKGLGSSVKCPSGIPYHRDI